MIRNLFLKICTSNLQRINLNTKCITTVSSRNINSSIVKSTRSLYQNIDARDYSKGKNKIREKKKGKVAIDINQLKTVIDIEQFQADMESIIQLLKDDYSKHINLRSATSSLEALPVEFDGKKHELQEIAQVIRKNPKTIVLNMSTFPQAIPDVLKAIQQSGLNLNPQQDSTNLYIPIPKVTTEHREQLSKNAKVLFNKCVSKIRDTHIDILRKINKKEGLSEDLVFDIKNQLTSIVEKYHNTAKDLSIVKHQELLKKD